MKLKAMFGLLMMFSMSSPIRAQGAGVIYMTSDIAVHFIVTDPHGRKTGVDPRGSANPWIGKEYDEIPGANYSTEGIGDNPDSNDLQESDLSHQFTCEIHTPEDDGIYQIDCFGLESKQFSLYVHLTPDDRTRMQAFNTRFIGVIDSNELVSCRIEYHGQPGGIIRFEKIVTPQIIGQDLDNCSELGLFGDTELFHELANMPPAVEQYLSGGDSASARQQLLLFQTVLSSKANDTTNVTPVPQGMISTDAWHILHDDAQSLIALLPSSPPGIIVKLVSSMGTKLTSGALQYYEGSWKDATNNNDGAFTINTTAKTLSLRMTYEYGTQTKSNVTVGPDTVVFQTVNAQIKLQDSKGNPMDTGTVQYYAGAWRNLGTTINGVATKELLPNSYTFRMTYAYGSNDKQQNIGTNPTVIFQTVNAVVQLQNSQGTLMDQGTVQYYSGAWRDLGVTSNGVATRELLPNNYSFRMTYAYASNDKQQNIGTNPTVVFKTVNATVQLKNSQGNLIPAPSGDQGTVQYYAGAWRDLGSTSGGTAAKELLPANYTFRMTYEYVSNDKAQDISANNTVTFSTVLCTVRVKDSQNQPVNNVQASYYSGAWRQIGSTVNGVVTKELLPANLTFRITYGTAHQDKTQNLSTNNIVDFSVQP